MLGVTLYCKMSRGSQHIQFIDLQRHVLPSCHSDDTKIKQAIF